MKTVELFVGAGGMLLGLEQAGAECIWACDMDQDALASLQNYRPGLDLQQVKLGPDFDYRGFADRIGEVDLVAGGPPCQPFSAAGKQRGRWDERDGFPWFRKMVAEVQPRAFLIENVKGLTFAKNLDYLSAIIRSLQAAGYTVDWRVLNAADYGVPHKSASGSSSSASATVRLFAGQRRRTAKLPWSRRSGSLETTGRSAACTPRVSPLVESAASSSTSRRASSSRSGSPG